MSVNLERVAYECDWKDEHGDVCGTVSEFSGGNHAGAARDAGWGAYANAYHRRTDTWKAWFCPVHATVFKHNHGWGELERFEPPTRWWENIWRRHP